MHTMDSFLICQVTTIIQKKKKIPEKNAKRTLNIKLFSY